LPAAPPLPPGGTGIEAHGAGRGGVEGTAQGGAEEGEAGAGITAHDDDAAGLDCGPAERGQPSVSGLAAGTAQKAANKVNNPCREHEDLIYWLIYDLDHLVMVRIRRRNREGKLKTSLSGSGILFKHPRVCSQSS